MDMYEIINTLKTFNPLSIFVYGSQATDQINSISDYEIGIIFDGDNYTNRSNIRKTITDKKYSIFPFRLTELQTYKIDTPFEKKIYISTLIMGGAKTIFGEKIIEDITPQP